MTSIKTGNLSKVERELESRGYGERIGIWSEELNYAAPVTLKRIYEIIGTDYSMELTIKGNRYILEMASVDGEIDFMITTIAEYRAQYGNDKY